MRPLRLGLPLLAALTLTACESTALFGTKPDGTVASAAPLAGLGGGLVARQSPDAPKDDVTLGKEHFRAQNYGLAEMHFRRAVEAQAGDAEAWLGLAAAHDQLKRYDLADKAYAQALKLTGPTPEFLNNRGYSYMMRGDHARASADLAAAAAADPGNERIQNNLRALDSRVRRAR